MKVLIPFRDKYNPERVYVPGEDFISDEPERINDLINRGLINDVEDIPSKASKKNSAKKSQRV